MNPHGPSYHPTSTPPPPPQAAALPLVQLSGPELCAAPLGSGDSVIQPLDDKTHFRLSLVAIRRLRSRTADALDGWLRVKCSPLVPINQSDSSPHRSLLALPVSTSHAYIFFNNSITQFSLLIPCQVFSCDCDKRRH